MMALGSVPVMTLTTPPIRFITNITTASQYPQRRPSHNPIVVKMQAIQTATISTMAAEPIRVNPARALGLRFQIGSRKLPGNVRDTAEIKLAHVPIAKRITSPIIPGDRALLMHPSFHALMPSHFVRERFADRNNHRHRLIGTIRRYVTSRLLTPVASPMNFKLT